MRIAIDSGPLTSGHAVRGVGFSTKQLIDSLLKYNKNANITIESVDFTSADLEKYDLLHATSFNPFFVTLPQKFIEKTIVTIHDLIPLIYPDVYVPGFKGKINIFRNRQLLKKVKKIITVSETSKKDIVRFFDLDEGSIEVIYWASMPGFEPIKDKKTLLYTKNRFKLPSRFVLYVGDVNYNKNIPVLVEACNKARIKLVIAGKQAKDIDSLLVSTIKSINGPQDLMRFLLGKPHPEIAHLKKLKDIFRSPNIIRLGFVPNEELFAIYNLASIYVQPSLYEGFGLPVLEAISCETPVIVSKTQALVEITQGKAGSFDPHDPKSLTVEIDKTLKDENIKRDTSALKIHFSQIYSWEKTANAHLKLYRNLIN